ncbi:hypothetical protein AVEN_155848-1 [Araneus ventricosus]|uniref:Retrovirus-related Pol polyprotein from transposon opus n=1 Tax=Araneus ventricosus TaxID=182803 RepID=A0A4Y2HTG4_ARAVE|nr:hypothetical protein AVEN_155848-1 [Araneus ventricosus]
MAKNVDNALSEDCDECNVTDSGINQILTQQLNTNKQILELSERVNAISTQNMTVNSFTEAPSTSSNVQIYQQIQCQIYGKCNRTARNCFLYTRGTNVSLIQPHIVDKIKTKTKVEYISRMVRIKTIDNTIVPYMSAINLKFKIEKKWFSNQFFVTLNPWNSHYHAILGYDFLQRNKVVIDTVNKQLLVGNQKFDFEENYPTNVYSESTDCDMSESDKDKKESFEQVNNNNCEKVNVSEETFHTHNVKIANNITIQPFSTEIINLKVPKNISKDKDLIFTPKKNKLGYVINESLNVPTDANLLNTISENKTNKVIHLRKNINMVKLSTFDVNDMMSTSESEIYQISNLNLNEIHKMRRDELLKSDFKLDHLNDKDKKDMQELLLKNFKVFSKSYKTLGETSAVTPEFPLLNNFPLQTKPYSIPLIAKKYAQQEINNLLEAGIIEPSSSSYCFPVIFIKKKQNPNDSNSEPKFRMVVDYRLLNSITETFKILSSKNF